MCRLFISQKTPDALPEEKKCVMSRPTRKWLSKTMEKLHYMHCTICGEGLPDSVTLQVRLLSCSTSLLKKYVLYAVQRVTKWFFSGVI